MARIRHMQSVRNPRSRYPCSLRLKLYLKKLSRPTVRPLTYLRHNHLTMPKLKAQLTQWKRNKKKMMTQRLGSLWILKLVAHNKNFSIVGNKKILKMSPLLSFLLILFRFTAMCQKHTQIYLKKLKMSVDGQWIWKLKALCKLTKSTISRNHQSSRSKLEKLRMPRSFTCRSRLLQKKMSNLTSIPYLLKKRISLKQLMRNSKHRSRP